MTQVLVYLDNIMVFGKTLEEREENCKTEGVQGPFEYAAKLHIPNILAKFQVQILRLEHMNCYLLECTTGEAEAMNHTTVVEFILLGLTSNRHLEILLFVVLLIVFLFILFGNLTVITITLVDCQLQTPMYFFLRNFSLLEICFTSTFMPRTLYSLLMSRKGISLPSCFMQLLLLYCFGSSTYFHLALMSLDRYMAICHPLHYATIMNSKRCVQLVLCCWAVGLLILFPPTVMIVLLPFCGPNLINHFYCDMAPLLQLSCTDTHLIELLVFFAAIIIVLGTLSVSVVSYGCIIATIMRIPSSSSQKKAFSTCSAHLIVVVIFYSASIIRYVRPSQRGGRDFDKNISFLYSVVTQLFNPYIYALRNKQVREALRDVKNSRKKNTKNPRQPIKRFQSAKLKVEIPIFHH
ncbi:olfactory receptor 6C4-like [Alligator sinensis]|uniref:Olfactory receptor 6C4-like n=1 Tax=Alligator sinensis TaxID=38654 RepID=A0A1U7S5F0_ALLSI|nr:olfactory receptor 6C4-like [Alligator sinensis]